MKVVRKKYTGKRFMTREDCDRLMEEFLEMLSDRVNAAVVSGLWMGKNTDIIYRAMPDDEFEAYVSDIASRTFENYSLMSFYKTLKNFYTDGVYQFMTEDELERSIRLEEEEGHSFDDDGLSWEEFLSDNSDQVSEEEKREIAHRKLIEKMQKMKLRVIK